MSAGLPSAMTRPRSRTTARSTSGITTSITCSTMRMVTPRRRIARTSSTPACASVGVSPVRTSSRRRSFGPVASARATSRRRFSGGVSAEASASRRAPRPVKSRISSAAALAAALAGRRLKAPTMTFSSTVIVSKLRTTWKVRAMPRRAQAAAPNSVTSSPAKRMRPDEGFNIPEIRLKSVVLPAPLGPMRPRISPSATAKLTASLATSPTKRRVTRSSSSSTRRLPADPRRGGMALQGGDETDEPLRLRHRDDHDERAVDDEVEAAAAAPDIAARRLRERDEDRGAECRPPERADAAQHGGKGDEDRELAAQDAVGIDEGDELGVDGADDASEEGAGCGGDELRAEDADADAFGGDGIVLDGPPGKAPARVLERIAGEPDDRGEGKEGVVIGQLRAAELEMRPAFGDIGDEDAAGAAHRIPVEEEQIADLRHDERRDGVVVAAHAEAGPADEKRGEGGGDACRHEAEQRRHARRSVEHGRDITADAEEQRLAQRDLAAIAAEDVPGLRQARIHHGEDEDVLPIGIADGERGEDERREDEAADAGLAPPVARFGVERRPRLRACQRALAAAGR